MHHGIEKVLFFYWSADDLIGLDDRLRVDFDVATDVVGVVLLLLLGIGVKLLVVVHVLYAEVAVLPEWVAPGRGVLAQAALVVVGGGASAVLLALFVVGGLPKLEFCCFFKAFQVGLGSLLLAFLLTFLLAYGFVLILGFGFVLGFRFGLGVGS